MRNLIIKRDAAVTEDCGPLLEKDENTPPSRTIRQILNQRFKAEDIYLNIGFLREFVLETGRIVPARVGGVSASQQREISQAIKLARYLGLMPYCDRHS